MKLSKGTNWLIGAAVAAVFLSWFISWFTGWPLNHIEPPPISRGLLTSNNWGDYREVSRIFSDTLRRRFPNGSSVIALRKSLVEDGFVRPSPHFDDCDDTNLSCSTSKYADTSDELEYTWGGVPCSQTMRAKMVADSQGRITALKGYYFASRM